MNLTISKKKNKINLKYIKNFIPIGNSKLITVLISLISSPLAAKSVANRY